jgi:hypothetical protein
MAASRSRTAMPASASEETSSFLRNAIGGLRQGGKELLED